MSDRRANVKFMFDNDLASLAADGPAAGVPLERLEAQICELAGHLAAATCLCPRHHTLVHDRGYLIAAPSGSAGTFAFYRPDGTRLPSCPPLPEPDGPIGQAHDAEITPDTIIPPWYGERLDLDYAIWVCFANARTREEREQGGYLTDPGRVTVYEPEDCDELIRQYLEHAPRRTGPVLIPIQV
jgi:hypothetical protein